MLWIGEICLILLLDVRFFISTVSSLTSYNYYIAYSLVEIAMHFVLFDLLVIMLVLTDYCPMPNPVDFVYSTMSQRELCMLFPTRSIDQDVNAVLLWISMHTMVMVQRKL